MNRFEDGISCGRSISTEERQRERAEKGRGGGRGRRERERERERENKGDPERNNSAFVLIVKRSGIACHEYAVRI